VSISESWLAPSPQGTLLLLEMTGSANGGRLTVLPRTKIDYISNTNIDHTKKSLVLLLELLLVKDLDSQYTFF